MIIDINILGPLVFPASFMLIDLLLLIKRVTECFCGKNTLSKKVNSHIVCYIAYNTTMYSTSVVNIIIVFCFFIAYDISPLLV